jgi:tryptophan 2,3-dioxygenase
MEKSKLTYNSYLHIPEIIGAQKPLANPEAHDEMLFIVIHQVYELWFKLVLFELDALVQNLKNDKMLLCYRGLDRVCEIFRVLIQQIDILETMSPVDFARFRSNLNPASGFQSLQFRALEIVSGANPEDYEKFSKIEAVWKDQLEVLRKKPSLRETFFAALKRHGLGPSDIVKIYSEPSLQSLHNLCEYMIRYDEQVLLWRFRHVQMVERMIGMQMGTGGSLGVPYLQQTLKKRFFPELWEARTQMVPKY